METEYTEAVATFLRERAAADAEIRAADRAYRAETERLATAVDEARTARDEADSTAVAASTLVAETDKTVTVLWRALGDFIGHRRTGPTPYLDAADPRPQAEGIRGRLECAGRLLTLARQGELPIEAPRHTELTAAAIGAGIGALAVAIALWILRADGSDTADAVRQALAAMTLFLGVAFGPVVLGLWLSWQYRVRPRPGQTLACVGAAIVAICALGAVFLRGL